MADGTANKDNSGAYRLAFIAAAVLYALYQLANAFIVGASEEALRQNREVRKAKADISRAYAESDRKIDSTIAYFTNFSNNGNTIREGELDSLLKEQAKDICGLSEVYRLQNMLDTNLAGKMLRWIDTVAQPRSLSPAWAKANGTLEFNWDNLRIVRKEEVDIRNNGRKVEKFCRHLRKDAAPAKKPAPRSAAPLMVR